MQRFLGQMNLLRAFLVLVFFALVHESALAQPYRGMAVGDVDADDIADLKNLLAPNIVRYQIVFFGIDQTPIKEVSNIAYLELLDEASDKLLSLLPSFEANGMKVVIDLHTPPGGFGSGDSLPVYQIYQSASRQSALITAWEHLATKFKDQEAVYAYDLINEPMVGTSIPSGVKGLNPLFQDLIDAIREIDSDTKLVVQPPYGDPNRIDELSLFSDSKIIYSFHTYYPQHFTSQKLGKFKKKRQWPDKQFGKKDLNLNLAKAFDFSANNDVEIYVGEFSVVCWAPQNSSARYLKFLIKQFEKRGWHWTYHIFRESSVHSLEHKCKPKKQTFTGKLSKPGKRIKKFMSKNN